MVWDAVNQDKITYIHKHREKYWSVENVRVLLRKIFIEVANQRETVKREGFSRGICRRNYAIQTPIKSKGHLRIRKRQSLPLKDRSFEEVILRRAYGNKTNPSLLGLVRKKNSMELRRHLNSSRPRLKGGAFASKGQQQRRTSTEVMDHHRN